MVQTRISSAAAVISKSARDVATSRTAFVYLSPKALPDTTGIMEDDQYDDSLYVAGSGWSEVRDVPNPVSSFSVRFPFQTPRCEGLTVESSSV